MTWLPELAVGSALAVLYLPTLRDLVVLWGSVPYYSYGFLVPLWSVWQAVAARRRLEGIAIRREVAGLGLVALGLAGLALAWLGGGLTVATLSLPVALAGLGWFALGREAMRPFAFPVGFLGLMAPLPPGLLPPLSLVLQDLAARTTQIVLDTMGIPVVREGLSLHLRSATLHVVEGCNGLRFLLAMAVLGVAFAWVGGGGIGRRLLVVTGALGAGLVANLVRVSGTAVLIHVWGPGVAIGLPHELFGKGIYLATLALFVLMLLRARRAERARAPRQLGLAYRENGEGRASTISTST